MKHLSPFNFQQQIEEEEVKASQLILKQYYKQQIDHTNNKKSLTQMRSKLDSSKKGIIPFFPSLASTHTFIFIVYNSCKKWNHNQKIFYLYNPWAFAQERARLQIKPVFLILFFYLAYMLVILILEGRYHGQVGIKILQHTDSFKLF